jgi:NDP-sugar pyrophosphorylase family protein
MRCSYCGSRLKADDHVILINGDVIHDENCFLEYVREHCAEGKMTYLEYLESEIDQSRL